MKTCGGLIIRSNIRVCFCEFHFLGQWVLLHQVSSQIKVGVSSGAGGLMEGA